MNEQPIIVKFLTKTSRQERPDKWLRQFPGQNPAWGRCRFVFDADAPEYDWLAVYDELPREGEEQSLRGREELACPPLHTILITAEPSSIKIYGRRFVRQFGCVLTSRGSTSRRALPRSSTNVNTAIVITSDATTWRRR